jgi:phosphoglycerol transferase MdoB-like AlkP superfamily enzyme
LFWRDTREVGVAAGLTVLFLFWSIKDRVWSLNWLALACLWVGIFMLVDRWRQRRKRPVTNDPLRSCIEASLIQVNHQIWLLKNVFWWYLLPLAIGAGIFIISLAWEIPIEGRVSRSEMVGLLLGSSAIICGLSFWLVYWLNQLAVRKHLEPRRQELESLLAGLDK